MTNVKQPAEIEAALEKCTAPRITADSIVAKIKDTRYLRDGITTICIIEMVNGFKLIGHSTPASPENFDASIGNHYAYENAFRGIWQLEGYLLREKLSTTA